MKFRNRKFSRNLVYDTKLFAKFRDESVLEFCIISRSEISSTSLILNTASEGKWVSCDGERLSWAAVSGSSFIPKLSQVRNSAF
jgi:hypothetical protein